MAWAFARQAQLACEVLDRYPGTSNLLQSTGRQAVYTASYFDYGELLVQRLFQAIAEAALEDHDNLGRRKPQDLSNIAWAFAVLGLSHTRFMETAKFELRRRARQFLQGETDEMNCFTGQNLANLLWALATLNIPVGDLLDDLESYFQMICQNDKGQITTESMRECSIDMNW